MGKNSKVVANRIAVTETVATSLRVHGAEIATGLARRAIPWKRLGVAEEVAHLVTYLASPVADFITGATYYIDGGASLWGDLFPLPDE